MARVLLIDDASEGFLDLVLRAQAAGHEVRWYIHRFDPVKRPVGKGFEGGGTEIVRDWRQWCRWCDLILLAANNYAMAEIARAAAEYKVPVIGGGPETAAWEIDRAHGMKVMQAHGVPVPPYREFSDFEQALAYVKRRDMPFAMKPSGHTDDKSLSFVAKTPEALAWHIQQQRDMGKKPGTFMLQEKVNGIEFAVGGWFHPETGWRVGWEENFEHKKLWPQDMSVNCGETGTVMRLVAESKLARTVLEPFEESLAKLGYIGNIDVNCIIDEKGNACPLEFTTRCGWPAFNIEMALHQSDPVAWLADLAAGRDETTATKRTLNEIALGVVLMIPPFPFSPRDWREQVGVPVYNLDPRAIPDNLHLAECQLLTKPFPMVAAAGGYVLIATGTADSVMTARRQPHADLKNLYIPSGGFYRMDIGARLKTQLPELQRHGYAKGMIYTRSPRYMGKKAA